MHTSGRCTVSQRHTLPSSARCWPEVGPVMSWPLASAQRLADAGPMRQSGISPATGRCWANVGPMSGQCRANAGAMPGRCHACPTIIADSMLVYIDPTSPQHRPDIGPTSARHRPNIGPTLGKCRTGASAQHQPNAGQMPLGQRWPNADPALVQFLTSYMVLSA